MNGKSSSLEYTKHLASAVSLLCGTVAELCAELDKNAYLLDAYVPMLMSKLSDEALSGMAGCRYVEPGRTYLQHTRDKLNRFGVYEKLNRLDRLARECFCAIGML